MKKIIIITVLALGIIAVSCDPGRMIYSTSRTAGVALDTINVGAYNNDPSADKARTAFLKSNAPIKEINRVRLWDIEPTELAILNGAIVTTTELNRISGVTSAVQTQILNRIRSVDSTGNAAGNYVTRKALVDTVAVRDAAIALKFTAADTVRYLPYTGASTNLEMGTNSITMAGSLGATGGRLLKGWMTDLEVTNLPTINGGTLKSALSLTAPDVGLGNVTNESKATMFTSPTFTVSANLPAATSIGIVSPAEILNLDGTTGSLNYSTENYGATGTGNIVLSIGPTLSDVTITGADIFYTPLSTGTITDATGITAAMLSRVMYYSEAAATDISSDPQIANGTSGQIITIIGSSDTNTLTLDDSTGLRLAGQCVLGIGDAITLLYEGTIGDWVEIGRSAN